MTIRTLNCPGCGATIELDESRGYGFCSYCGRKIMVGEHIHVHVTHEYEQGPQGNPHVTNNYYYYNYDNKSQYNGPNIYSSPKSRLVALVLCFFFGVLGFHRFYIGKIGTGIIYLLTGGLFGIGWIIDFIMILCGAYRDRYGRIVDKW